MTTEFNRLVKELEQVGWARNGASWECSQQTVEESKLPTIIVWAGTTTSPTAINVAVWNGTHTVFHANVGTADEARALIIGLRLEHGL